MKNDFQTSEDAEQRCISLLKFLIDLDYSALLHVPKFLNFCGTMFMVFAAFGEIELF